VIHGITSDLPSFKTLTFGPGLNILLADKSRTATDRHSRNGAGKTSLIELIHFLLGADCRKDSIFRADPLKDRSFRMTLDLDHRAVTVTRSGATPAKLLLDGDLPGWPWHSHLMPTDRVDRYSISNEHWKALLGHLWFGLPVDEDADTSGPFKPTFRSLFSYFVRRQASGGFLGVERQAEKQQTWDQQIAISYLLGLDWRLPRQFQELRGQEKLVRELGRAGKAGELGRFFGRAADLRTRLTVTEARAQEFRERLRTFHVVPEYADLEREAAAITQEIANLNNDNVVDRDLLIQLRESLDGEDAPGIQQVEKLYAEAGVVLPDLVSRRIHEVEDFHRAVVQNRRAHLSAEIQSAEDRIREREQHIVDRDRRRVQLMAILQEGGALEHYVALREELGRLEAEVEGLRQRLELAERLESTRAELDVEKASLVRALRNDLHERDGAIRHAILTFENLSKSLYENAGSLSIGDSPHGPTFEVQIQGQRSKGITNMQIFCFDLMLIVLGQERQRSPGFLVHDSHLFDGVDERQIANALQVGARLAEQHGFQYIVTLNSDVLPSRGYQADFDIERYIMPVRLTDATETGGLFGLRFE